jgi:hypothetical protein
MHGEALRALKHAERIYDEESATVTSGVDFKNFPVVWEAQYVSWPPRFYWEYASFFARRKNVDGAQRWLVEFAAFYKRQGERHPYLSLYNKEKCLRDGARAYLEIASLHYLINQDLDGCKQWLAKYRGALPEKRARSSGVNLLDTEGN